MVVRPGGPADGSAPARVDVTQHDHPLSLQPDSQWQAFFKDNDVLGQIDKDVRWVAPPAELSAVGWWSAAGWLYIQGAAKSFVHFDRFCVR